MSYGTFNCSFNGGYQQCCADSFTYDSHGFVSEIELPKPQLIFFSVPYSKGWTAEVNGKKADVERVNEGFMAVRAETGKNTIVFRYRTPYLAAGIIISICAAAALAVYVLLFRRKDGKDNDYAFRHWYGYDSCSKIKTAVSHCDSLFDKKENQ